SLSQIGEFSFILAQIGVSYSLLQDNEYQLFLAVSIITMALTPFLIKYSEKITEKIVSLPFPNAIKFGLAHITIENNKGILKDHIIIVGYGINGKNVAAAARSIKIPYIIIEMNPDTVKFEKRKGEYIIYGDASQEDLLHYVNVDSARVMVIAIADRSAIKRIIMLARGLNSQIHIIVRTRFVGDIKELMELGANEVIPEEYETSIEIFARVLRYYGVPQNDIDDMVQKIRSQGYAMLRQLSANTLLDLPITEIDMQPIRVCGQSPAIQKTIGQMQFRKLYKFSIVAIKRGSNIITNPGADDEILDDDILYVVGNRDAIREAVKILRMSVNLDSCDV
ncbi:MAG: NAD-binding protein, partial [Spirochaetota bacterium]